MAVLGHCPAQTSGDHDDSVPASGSAGRVTRPSPPPGSWPAPGPTARATCRVPLPGPPPGPAGSATRPVDPRRAGSPPWGPPVHQPGVVPLRPLTLGDIFGGAIQTVRRNPKATVGLAAVVTFGFMLIPMLATLVLGASGGGAEPRITDADGSSSRRPRATSALVVSSVASRVFSALASIVVTGLIVRVVEQAVVGRRITAAEAWQRSRGGCFPCWASRCSSASP